MSEWREFQADDPSTHPPANGLAYVVYGAMGLGVLMWGSTREWIGRPSVGPVRCWLDMPRVPDEFR